MRLLQRLNQVRQCPPAPWLFPCVLVLTLGLGLILGSPATAATRNLAGLNANTLAANDDGSTGVVNIGFTVNFYGVVKSSLYVNNNGNFTFNNALSSFTPQGLAKSVTEPMIAAFFADVDTRGSGSGLTKYGTDTVCGRKVFGANWFNVGYFSSHVDKLNTFQLILIERGDTGNGNFDIEMNYDKIQWETGDASGGSGGIGGTSIEAGYTNGASGAARVSYEFPGSRVNGAMLDGGKNALISNSYGSNVKGRYYFTVRGGKVTKVASPGGGSQGGDVTSSVHSFFPLRYHFNPLTDQYSGSLHVGRRGTAKVSTQTTTSSLTPTQKTDNCLGITASTKTKTSTTSPKEAYGPVTIVFRKTPGVTLANATGTTAKGYAYLQLPGASLPPGDTINVPIKLRNPSRLNLTSYRQGNGWDFRVILGPFNKNNN